MELKSLSCDNVLSFKEGFSIEFGKRNFIVGPNNSGKTNINRIFEFVSLLLRTKGGYFGDKQMIQNISRFNRKNIPFKIMMKMEVSKEDKDRILKYFYMIEKNELHKFKSNGGLELEINSNSIRIAERQSPNLIVNKSFPDIFSRLWKKYCQELLTYLLDDNQFSIILYYDGGFNSIVNLMLGLKNNTVFMNTNGSIRTDFNFDRGGTAFSFREFFIQNRQFELNGRDDEKIVSSMMDQTIRKRDKDLFDFKFSFNELDQELMDSFKKEMSSLFPFIRDINEHIIINLLNLFQIWISNMMIMSSNIRNYKYYNAFSDYLDILNNQTTDYSTHLPSILYALKNSSNPNDKYLFAEIQRKFKDISNGLILDVASHIEWVNILELNENTVGEHSKFRQAITPGGVITVDKGRVDGYTGTIWITITNESGTINHSLDYAGSGLYELGYLLFLLLIKKDILILDEPALNLHPIWQKEISKLIEEYCSIGQSIVITHSPYILPDFTKENIIDYIIYHFSLDSQDHSTVNSIINLKKEHLLNTMKYRKMIDKFKTIFFADIVIVVEGESDERLIQEIINEKFIHEQKNLKNIDVINTGGGNDPVKLFKLLKSWSIPVLLIVDNDKEMDLDKEGLSNLPTILLLHSDLEGTIVIGDLLDIIFRFKDASKISIKSEIKKFGKDNNHYRVLEILKSVDTILKESSLDDKDIQEVIKKLVNNPEMIPKSEWDRMNVELNRDKNRISEKISYFIDRKYFEIESKIERIIEILNDENNPILTYCPQQILDFIGINIHKK